MKEQEKIFEIKVSYELGHRFIYRMSHLVVDWLWLTRINIVPLSANLCLG